MIFDDPLTLHRPSERYADWLQHAPPLPRPRGARLPFPLSSRARHICPLPQGERTRPARIAAVLPHAEEMAPRTHFHANIFSGGTGGTPYGRQPQLVSTPSERDDKSLLSWQGRQGRQCRCDVPPTVLAVPEGHA